MREYKLKVILNNSDGYGARKRIYCHEIGSSGMTIAFVYIQRQPYCPWGDEDIIIQRSAMRFKGIYMYIQAELTTH